MTFGPSETHAPADLKQLQELLAAATPGPWRSMAEDKYTVAVIGQSNNEDRWVAENVREPNAQLIVAMHEALPALLASHVALSAEVAGLRATAAANVQKYTTSVHSGEQAENAPEYGVCETGFPCTECYYGGHHKILRSGTSMFAPRENFQIPKDDDAQEVTTPEALEIIALRKDAERLDFCQKRGFSIFQAWRTEKWRLEGQNMEYDTLRAAIDAARQEKKDA